MDERPTGGGWTKSPPELQSAFAAALEQFPDAERRQMFGYPAGFANGNMWTSLFQHQWVVRLPDEDRAELIAGGGAPFEPMPGRAMRGFATLPAEVLADPERLRRWLERAWQAALAMPPKKSGAKRGRA